MKVMMTSSSMKLSAFLLLALAASTDAKKVGASHSKRMGMDPAQANSSQIGQKKEDACDVAALSKYVWETRGHTGGAEGGTDNAEFIEEQTVVKEVGAKTICETGFNFGASSLAWLCSAPDATVHSFDNGVHDYVPIARDYLIRNFGKHRLTLILGDSTVTLPKAIKAKNISCDLAFVDGGHTTEIALADIKNFRELTVPKGRMLLENCNVQGKANGWGGMQPVNDAYQEALKQGIIKHERQISTPGCQGKDLTKCREICVASYL